MSELAKPDLVGQGMSLLPYNWEDKLKVKGLLKSFLQAFQNPLDLIFEILNGTSLFDAEGVQLDLIGKYWNVKRYGDTDDTYRKKIFNIVSRQIADGTPERIIEITKVFSNVTNVRLFEHYPGNVHVRYNTGVNEGVKTLGSLISPAGISFNGRFEPIDDNTSLTTPPIAFDYRNSNVLIGSWIDSNTTYTGGVGNGPDGTNTLYSLQDASAVVHGYRYQSLPGFNPSKRYFISAWIKKDGIATHNALLRVKITGGISTENYDVEVKVSNGSYQNNGSAPKKLRVMDLDAYYFVWMEVKTSDLTQTSLTVELYPAISTTLGTYNVATVGTTAFWTAIVAEVDETKYNSAYPAYNTFRFAERISKEYLVIDELSNNIVAENLDQIIAEVITRVTIDSRPLAEFGNITQEQALTEVI